MLLRELSRWYSAQAAVRPDFVVVSVHRPRVHYQAPPANTLDAEMAQFLDWFNTASQDDPLIKAGLAHLWFVTVHPMDDGNGRMGHAVGDLALARAEGTAQRYYSLSAQIQRER